MTARLWNSDVDHEIALRYTAGENSKQLALAYGTSPMTILNACRRMGVEVRKPGQPRSRELHPRWKGGVRKSGKGYLLKWLDPDDPHYGMTHAGGNYVALHRYVVAQLLGRDLRSDESVHHINGDPTDNRPENLQLRSVVSHGQGQVRQCGDCGSSNIVCVELS